MKSNLNTRPLNAKPKQKIEPIRNKEFAYPQLLASRCSVLAIEAEGCWNYDAAAFIRLSAKQRPYKRLQVHSWTRMCLRNVDAASQSSAKDSRKLFRNSLRLAACPQPEGEGLAETFPQLLTFSCLPPTWRCPALEFTCVCLSGVL